MQKTNADSRGGLHIPMPRYSETSAADQAVTNAMLKALRTVRSATSPAPASPTELERQRLELMRMKVTGEVDDGEDGDEP